MTNSKKIFETTITPLYSLFYSQESNFGIFQVTFHTKNDDAKEMEKIVDSEEFTVVGIMPSLEKQKIYNVRLTETFHKKYGKQFKVENIYEKAPTTKEEQKNYLSTILTEQQVHNLFQAYPNEEDILDLILKDEIDISIVTGLGEKTYLRLKEKVLENLQYREALIELTYKFGLTNNTIKKLVDAYKSASVLIERIYKNPYELIEKVNGIGFLKADEIAMLAGIPKDSPYRIMACVFYILKENQLKKGHCYILKKQLFSEMYKLLKLKKSYIEEVFDENYMDFDDLFTDDKRIALQKIYDAEKNISEHLSELLENSWQADVGDLKYKMQLIEQEQGFQFTDEQEKAIELACKYNVIFISGKAGTGKTSVMKGILKILIGETGNLKYETCAFSGKASQRIKESTNYESQTIHRLLKFGQGGNIGFLHNAENPLEADVFILDEASMVNSTLFSSLVEAIPIGAKLIVMGDIAQLEAIGEGFCFGDLLSSNRFPKVELTKVHRQALKSGILKVANLIREGKNFMKNIPLKYQRLGELKDLFFIPCKDQEKVLKHVLNISEKFAKSSVDVMDLQVIVPTKKQGKLSCNELNKHLQEIFNPAFVNQRKMKYGSIEYREKDKIITKGNDYKKLVFNGTLGIIERLDEISKTAFIRFEDGKIHEYSLSEFENLELGYALSIHRCQGSQFKYCIVGLDSSSWIMLSRQLLYTALTRSIHQCFFIGQVKAIDHAIRSNPTANRMTFLPSLLKEKSKFLA